MKKILKFKNVLELEHMVFYQSMDQMSLKEENS